MKIIQTIKSRLIKLLNNKKGRSLLSLIFSLISSLKKLSLYYIFYDNTVGLWIHKKGNEIIVVDDLPDFAISKERTIAVTLRIFFKHYSPKPTDVLIDIGAGIGNDVFVMNSYFKATPSIYAIEKLIRQLIRNYIQWLK